MTSHKKETRLDLFVIKEFKNKAYLPLRKILTMTYNNYTKKLSIPVFLLLSLQVAIILHFPLWVSVDSLSLKSPSCTSSILSKWKSPRSARLIISKPSTSSVANNFYRSNIIPAKSFSPLYTTSDDNIEQTEFDSSSSSSSFEASINNNTTIDITATTTTMTTTAADTTSISNNNKSDDSSTTTAKDDSDGLLPSYKRLIVFTATTILIWLSEPLLSLVDTAIVSLTASAKSGVVQIAALGPATTLFDSLIYTTYFLAMVTTNQLAPALASAAKKESKNKNSSNDMNNNNNNNISNNIYNPWQDLRQSTSHLLGLSLVFGCIVSAITFTAGKSIIGQMVGGSLGAVEANAIIPLATTYATIRAAVAPFSVVGFVAQSFCLTTLDVATPAIAVAAASIVNIIGDLALSPTYGIQGAAVATAMATVTSCLILLRKVRKTTTEWKTKQEKYEAKARVVSATATATSATNVEAIKDDKKSDHIPFWSLPNKSSMIDLFKLAGPIFFVMMAKVACYNVMTIRATNFGIVPLASHNIMMRIFFFFACFGDSLSQAAQSFYPQVSEKMRGKLIKRLFYIASAVGICNFNMSQLILSKLGRFLAKDSNIIHLMAQHSPWVGYAVLLHPFIMLLEGTVLAKRDLVFMVATYVITSLLHFGFVFSPVSSSFVGLWRALFGFQLIRLVQFALRVWTKSRRKKKENNNIGSVEQEGIIPAPPL